MMLPTIATGISAFAATNLDDLFVLILLFSQVSPNHYSAARRDWRSIVLGQYLGFSLLVGVSLLGFFGGLLVPHDWLRGLGLLPIGIGISALWSALWPKSDGDQASEAEDLDQQSPRWIAWQRRRTAEVAALTIANGSDNLSIYIPLFVNQTIENLILLIVVFYSMVALWCVTAVYLTRHSLIARGLQRYGTVLIPWILIAIGLQLIIFG